MTRILRFFTIGVLAVAIPGIARAQSSGDTSDLARLSLEELMAMEVTTVSRREQRAEGVAAAVSVITQDDIRRSGLRSVPELLRLVPGVQVARVNASNWAVSVRGFNDVYSNKLLVLIDGRSIYNHAFSGVFWNAEDLLIDDIDRIEVIRGPGGSIWGANAVNGVINIVTKSARNTEGTLVRLSQKSFDGTQGAFRYGGSVRNTSYRLYSQWSNHGQSQLGPKIGTHDEWKSLATGFRLDRDTSTTQTMVTGNFSVNRTKALWLQLDSPGGTVNTSDGDSNRFTGSLLGRWTRAWNGNRSLQVQSFVTHRTIDDPIDVYHERTLDVDAEYQTALGRRHELVLGGGLRRVEDRNDGTFSVSFVPNRSPSNVANVFAQDEWRLTDRVRVTVGSKFEHDTTTGGSLQPAASIAWDIAPSRHTAWAGVSRALRTPSSTDLRVQANVNSFPGPDGLPIVVRVVGNPNFRSEGLVNQEIGYRFRMRSSLNVDATVFHGRYSGLRTTEPQPAQFEMTPGPPHIVMPLQFANLLDAQTTGLEVGAHWTPTGSWRVDGSYTAFRFVPHPLAGSQDPSGPSNDGNAPAHQWQIQSTAWLSKRLEFDAALFYVGRLERLDVPAYTRADVRLEFKVSPKHSLIATGQNLLDARHFEYSPLETTMVTGSVPRSGGLLFAWRF
jgi:iron complex outermembrane receptor protein